MRKQNHIAFRVGPGALVGPSGPGAEEQPIVSFRLGPGDPGPQRTRDEGLGFTSFRLGPWDPAWVPADKG